MGDYNKDSIRYIAITPSGAYFATLNPTPDDARALLLQLLSTDFDLLYSLELVSELADLDEVQAMGLFQQLLDRGFVALTEAPPEIHRGPLEELLPDMLKQLSGAGKALLADDQGFCLSSTGFSAEQSETLSALAADLISLQERHKRLLNGEMGLAGDSWGIMNAAGQSQIGCWVVHIGHQRFCLVISDMPKLNQQAFAEILGCLARRYLEY
ncbi:hypothetical protein [Amphritea balenae]|uniref:Roadblock/LC7 domain-containing protein n=1 Tax=Amphritea balenae TaxID=452629 RepID=A0A3P1SLY6_9GAMM|nr:hypothetical protein [Amphritea balenae]RRC97725.1 hypothetical protein EHS89_16215 [Amphritea balenae]GGK82500.1 hypothetical protein GCM10007941_36190 [Amphritea balenae]